MNLPSSPAWTIPGRYSNSNKNLSPGPGQYNPGLMKFENSPGFRIGTSNRTGFQKSFTPGPGAYAPAAAKWPTSPGYSCGKGNRLSLGKSESPGPGTYNCRSFLVTVGGKIGKSSRTALDSAEKMSKTPGPGSYLTPSKIVEGPRFSMTNRRPSSAKSVNPGPGAYRVDFNWTTTKENSPCYRIGSAGRSTITNLSSGPGPGRYSVESLLNGPKWAFGTSGRNYSGSRNQSPGPGSYSIMNKWISSGYTIQGRYKNLKEFNPPGPGAYSPSFNKDKSSAWTMGRSARSTFQGKFMSPGPGAYIDSSTLSKTLGVFSRAARSTFQSQKLAVPGPGHYSSTFIEKAPAYSMRGRSANIQQNRAPGPGQYSCMYDTRAASAGWTFGRARRGKDLIGMGPGPGAYTLQSTIGNVPSYSNKNHS